jgi:predicted CXXCH cytochrome family protein
MQPLDPRLQLEIRHVDPRSPIWASAATGAPIPALQGTLGLAMAAVELVLCAFVALVGLALAARGAARPAMMALLACVLVVALLAATRSAPSRASVSGAPLRTVEGTAAGSGACRSCHPSEHASWHRSFHRTMTQLATPDTVKGPFDGVRLEVEGRSIELSRRGDELWARLPDPDAVARAILGGHPQPAAGAPLVSRRVILATGSHHQQVYWVRGERGNELRLVPITYLIAERRYVPRRDAFLQPPDAPAHALRWNSNCVQCHSTLGQPAHDEAGDRFATEAVELGIACEACHGAGSQHIRKHQNPLTRLTAHVRDEPDPSIVNPGRLSPERASDVCGQCHAYFVPRDEARWWQSGFATSFRPGDAIEATRILMQAPSSDDQGDGASRAHVDAEAESLFWGDGTIRVGGRELNGMRGSACFERGRGERQISCLSCHSMHQSDPDDQLRDAADPDAPCRRCHETIAARPSEHTHHAPDSAGSSCVGCHMPYTSYALFRGIRSHHIDSPSTESDVRNNKPNACNLCHVDRTLRWTAETLAAWYGVAAPALPAANDVSLILEKLLTGDAAERVIAAWALGRPEARRAAGTGFQPPFLGQLLQDPYSAVRKVACDALAGFPDFSDFSCDFLAEAVERKRLHAEVTSRFLARSDRRREPSLLFDATGALDEERIRALLRTRNDRPTTIAE